MATALALVVAACGDDDTAAGSGDATVVVTTNILGDVVRELVGDAATVEVLMPVGADPHELAPSPQQVEDMREADLLVVNGGGFEVGLRDAIDAARNDGVPTVVALDGVPAIALAGEHGEERKGPDPHFFSDPARMHDAVELIASELRAHVAALATDAFDARVARYLDELRELDQAAEVALATIPDERRVLVTNHEVLGYFADRYGFDVLGVIIPGGSTLAEPSAAELDQLADRVKASGVPAIFADTSAPTRLADALAAEGANVAVVELFSESLGDEGSGAETYLEMVRTNVDRIVGALAP